MRSIKNLVSFQLLIVLIFTFSCNDNESDSSSLNELLQDFGSQYGVFEIVVNDIESLTFDMLSELDEKDPTGSTETHLPEVFFFGRGSCASITNDYDLNEIIIDFGNGCVDNKGIFREGSLIIRYQKAKVDVLDEVFVELIDYKFQNQSLQGSLSIIRRPNSDLGMQFDIEFQALELVTGSNTMILNGQRSLEFYLRDPNPEERALFLSKSGNGNFNGRSFTFESMEKSMFWSACTNNDFFLPKMGIDNLNLDNRDFTFDYIVKSSRGTDMSGCDYLFRIIDGENRSIRIDLSPFVSQ